MIHLAVLSLLFLSVGYYIYPYLTQTTSKPKISPGIAWKVHWNKFPELEHMMEEWKKTCLVPDLSSEYEELLQSQDMRQLRWDIQKMEGLDSYYEPLEQNALQKNTHHMARLNKVTEKLEDIDGHHCVYKSRIGCWMIQHEKNYDFVEKAIQALCRRLGIEPDLKHTPDCRGSTYMPPQGCFEPHTNRDHHSGWRMYFHYLPKGGNSYFNYVHPHDGTLRQLKDENERFNIFRLRAQPNPLLWHGIWSDDAHRFSLGVWCPSELAHYLITEGETI